MNLGGLLFHETFAVVSDLFNIGQLFQCHKSTCQGSCHHELLLEKKNKCVAHEAICVSSYLHTYFCFLDERLQFGETRNLDLARRAVLQVFVKDGLCSNHSKVNFGSRYQF